jgi:hypothetical protein
MISHEHRCIFIHIPRTGGTSIEVAFTGNDLFNVIPFQKHLTARQSKDFYGDYWDDYFKFSIVRNPWDRVISLYHFEAFRDINVLSGKSMNYFLETYEPYSHEPNPCDCNNIIDLPLDFIGRFENIEEDFKSICDHLEVSFDLPHIESTKHGHYSGYYNEETKQIVAEKYSDDIKRFGYDFAQA